MIKIEKIEGPLDWYKATVKTLKETVEFEGPPKTIEWHVNDYLFRNGHQIEDVKKIIQEYHKNSSWHLWDFMLECCYEVKYKRNKIC